MNHTECRDTIAFDEVDEITLEHLEQCVPCRSFAEDMRRLEALAAELAPPPPAEIADRVLAAVQPALSPTATVLALRRSGEPVSRWRAASRSLGVRVTSAAAVLVLIAAVATAVVQNRQQEPADLLLASAESTAEAGTGRLHVSATTHVVLSAPAPSAPGRLPAAPDFSSAPIELRGQLQSRWEGAMAQFEAQLQDFFDEVDRSIDAGTRQMDDALRQLERQLEESLRQFGGPGRRANPPPPQPQPPERRPAEPPAVAGPPQPPAPPAQVSAQVVVDAIGTVDFAGQRIALDGAVRTGGGRAPFHLAATGDTAVYRSGARPWARLPGRAGPLGTLVLDPHAILRIARSATDVTAETGVTVRGETMERYTFTVDGSATAGLQGHETWRAEALVDADGRLRRVDLATRGHGAGDDAQVRTHVTMELSDLGEERATAPLPAAARGTTLPPRSSLPLYPFNASVRAAQQRRDR